MLVVEFGLDLTPDIKDCIDIGNIKLLSHDASQPLDISGFRLSEDEVWLDNKSNTNNDEEAE